MEQTLTLDAISFFREVRELYKETDRQFREMSKEFREMSKETDRKFQDTERLMKQQSQETDKKIGKLTNRLGEFIEEMVRPGAVRLFRERGIGFKKC
ncbi:MAG: hypothetical protein HQK70_12160 [Desulfamplus sp.]|nr:hypothetical protein [Desulfamplus sp.]